MSDAVRRLVAARSHVPGRIPTGMMRRPRPRTLCLAVLAILVVALASSAAYRIGRLRRAAGVVVADVQRVQIGRVLAANPGGGTPRLADLQVLRRDLGALEAECAAWRRLAAPWAPALAEARWVPAIPDAAAALSAGLDAAERLVRAAWWVTLALESDVELDGTTNVASGVQVAISADLPRTLGEALERQRPALLAARVRLADACGALSRLPLVPERWAALGRSAPFAVDALLIGGRLVASPEPHNILLLVQNNDERRATGGFISSVALLRWEGGRLAGVDYRNSKDIEAYRAVHPAPPEALRRIMGASILLLRDANWSPDFPTSAEVVASLYEMDMETSVHDVVAVDAALGALLLEALGPIEVPAYGVTVTADNLMDVVVDYWEAPLAAPALGTPGQGADWLAHRKDVGGALLEAGLARVRGLASADLLALAGTLEQAVRGRHLLAWSLADRVLQEDLDRAGVSGRMRTTTGDYIQVIDSNVGWNKADRKVSRSVLYRLTLEGESLVAEAILTYRNDAVPGDGACDHRSYYGDSYEALTNRCYWNYLRLYVPAGATLLAAEGVDGAADVGSELGRRVFGGLLVVPPGEARTVTFRYRLSEALVAQTREDAYTLLLQQQAGSTGSIVTVEAPGARDLRAVDGAGRAISARSALGPLPWEGDWHVQVRW